MLDEAIEYLKSLQLQLQVSIVFAPKMFLITTTTTQSGVLKNETSMCDVCIVAVQMMWMGGGMAAAAAPVMFPAGVHQYMQRMVASPHVASMPRMPFLAPPAVQSPPGGDPYAHYLAVDHLQPPPPPAAAPMVPPRTQLNFSLDA